MNDPRIGSCEGQGHACSPTRPAMAARARLKTHRYSTRARMGLGSARVIGLATGLTD